MWICCVLWKSDEWWSCVLLNLEWIHGYLLLMMFETCWWIGVIIMLLVDWWWKLLLLLNNYESLVNFWILTKWRLNHEFWASLSTCLCIWPINIIWDEFWVWKDQNWSVWKKRVLKFEVFFWTEECSLKRACLDRFWTQFAWANRERSLSEQQCRFWTEFPWANRKRAPSEHTQDASELWSLKRTRLRLSEQHPVQPHLIFRFEYFGTNPNFLNGFFWLI